MKLIIIGNGGHKKVVSEIAEQLGHEINGIIDDSFKERFVKNDICYGNSFHIKEIMRETNSLLFFGIGNNEVRRTIYEREHLNETMFATLISPQAIVSKTAKIGKGTLIMPGAIINADAIIGSQTIINSGAVVEHDCVVQDFVHVSPNATLTGGVRVGNGTQIGAAAVVNPTLIIGDWVTVGSGASVIDNIESHALVVGVPAKSKKMQ